MGVVMNPMSTFNERVLGGGVRDIDMRQEVKDLSNLDLLTAFTQTNSLDGAERLVDAGLTKGRSFKTCRPNLCTVSNFF